MPAIQPISLNDTRLVVSDGSSVVVDAEDHDRCSRLRWCKNYDKTRRYFRVARLLSEPDTGKRFWYPLANFVLGAPRGVLVDHVNRDQSDFRKGNLRPADRSTNIRNTAKYHRACSSRFKGVSWDKRCHRWYAKIRLDGKQTRLGVFLDEEDAGRAYDQAAREMFGEFACTNEDLGLYRDQQQQAA